MSATAKAEQVVYTFRAPVRAAFINAVAAKRYKKNGVETGEPRFDATFLLEPDSADLVALKDLCIAMAKQQLPGKKLVARRLTQEELDDGGTVEVNMPWSDGTKQADAAKQPDQNGKTKDREFMRGKIVVKASSKFAPALSGIENGKVVSYTDEALRPSLTRFFYSGAWVGPYVALHYYPPGKTDGKPGGVSLWLNGLCFVKHDAKLMGASVNAAEVFAHYAGTVSNDDPTGGDEL